MTLVSGGAVLGTGIDEREKEGTEAIGGVLYDKSTGPEYLIRDQFAVLYLQEVCAVRRAFKITTGEKGEGGTRFRVFSIRKARIFSRREGIAGNEDVRQVEVVSRALHPACGCVKRQTFRIEVEGDYGVRYGVIAMTMTFLPCHGVSVREDIRRDICYLGLAGYKCSQG